MPTAKEVIARLGDERGAVDRAARLLLEEPSSNEEDLPRTFGRLLHRWRKRRQVELMRQIKNAQEQGDQDRLAELLEKNGVSAEVSIRR